MTAEQLLRLINLLHGREGDLLQVEITPYAQSEDGSQKYAVEIRTLQDDGEWQLTMDEVV